MNSLMIHPQLALREVEGGLVGETHVWNGSNAIKRPVAGMERAWLTTLIIYKLNGFPNF